MSPSSSVALTPEQVYEKVRDSIFVVKSLNEYYGVMAFGSGVLLPSGKVGTNCHVIEDGTHVILEKEGKASIALLYAGDKDKDICLLDAIGIASEPAQLGNSTRLRVGEAVYAVGAPEGLELSLTSGIVSSLRGAPPSLIQITAPVSHGSSGGGLFDSSGLLLGFTTYTIRGGQNINFAVPVEWIDGIESAQQNVSLEGDSSNSSEQSDATEHDEQKSVHPRPIFDSSSPGFYSIEPVLSSGPAQESGQSSPSQDDSVPWVISDDLERPGYIRDNPVLNFPIRAWAYGHQGRVIARVQVLEDGTTGEIWIKQSSGSGILDQDAIEQLTNFRFRPARKKGQPVTSWIDVPVDYRLGSKKQ